MRSGKWLLIVLMLSWIVSLSGCGDVQQEYYEVHVIVVDDQPFYFIDPSEGKDTLSANQLGEGETLFVYLYEPIDGVEFTYNHFFSTIQSQYVETNVKNDKLYVLANATIDNQITQYFLDKFAWQESQS